MSMAKKLKLKCNEDEIASWMKNAKNSMQMIPDASKATVASQKRVFEKTINEEKGCVPRPKGGGGGARTKELSVHYRAIQEKTGKAWKDFNKD